MLFRIGFGFEYYAIFMAFVLAVYVWKIVGGALSGRPGGGRYLAIWKAAAVLGIVGAVGFLDASLNTEIEPWRYQDLAEAAKNDPVLARDARAVIARKHKIDAADYNALADAYRQRQDAAERRSAIGAIDRTAAR